MPRVRIIVTVVALCVLVPCVWGQSSSSIRKEQRRKKQQVEQAERDVKKNAQAVEANLNRLELLEGQIADINKDVTRLQLKSDSIINLIRPLNDSIEELNSRLSNMSSKYHTALRKSQTNANSMSDLTFVFSSDSFLQAWQRYRSLRQFARWRKRKADEITTTKAVLASRYVRLDSLRLANSRILNKVEAQRDVLEHKRVETDHLVKSLKTQSRQLEQVLKNRQREIRQLEARLEEAIANEMEQRRRQEEKERQEQAKKLAAAGNDCDNKPSKTSEPTKNNATQASTQSSSEQKLTGSFESNKGKLPFPVNGEYTIVKKFGRQKHPRLPKVETNNPGIDIEAGRGAGVHAVFDGEVSQIFKLAGYNNVVVLRHGDYVTVYANIATLSVKKGDKVTTGQFIGNLYVDKADDNRSILHFELRKEKEKQNPELWLKSR